MFYIALTNNILYLKSQSYREMIDMEWKGSADHGNPLELEKGKPCVTKLQNEKLQDESRQHNDKICKLFYTREQLLSFRTFPLVNHKPSFLPSAVGLLCILERTVSYCSKIVYSAINYNDVKHLLYVRKVTRCNRLQRGIEQKMRSGKVTPPTRRK